MLKEFKEFVSRGNVIDMAVGIIIGASFSSIVNSLVKDIIMPPIGWIMGNVDFSGKYLLVGPGKEVPPPYLTLADAQAAGAVTINYGMFINSIINFLIVAVAIFMMIKVFNRLQRLRPSEPAEPTTKACPYCAMNIPVSATRCPNCTSDIKSK